jgi:hypothetical protein
MAQAGETTLLGDLLDRDGCGLQEVSSSLYPQVGDIACWRCSGLLFEDCVQVVRTDTQHVRKALHRQSFCEMVVDESNPLFDAFLVELCIGVNVIDEAQVRIADQVRQDSEKLCFGGALVPENVAPPTSDRHPSEAFADGRSGSVRNTQPCSSGKGKPDQSRNNASRFTVPGKRMGETCIIEIQNDTGCLMLAVGDMPGAGWKKEDITTAAWEA